MFDAGARFYSLELCQFTGVDPVDQSGRSSYAYANNNPQRFTDPDGRDAKPIIVRDDKGNIIRYELQLTGYVAGVNLTMEQTQMLAQRLTVASNRAFSENASKVLFRGKPVKVLFNFQALSQDDGGIGTRLASEVFRAYPKTC